MKNDRERAAMDLPTSSTHGTRAPPGSNEATRRPQSEQSKKKEASKFRKVMEVAKKERHLDRKKVSALFECVSQTLPVSPHTTDQCLGHFSATPRSIPLASHPWSSHLLKLQGVGDLLQGTPNLSTDTA